MVSWCLLAHSNINSHSKLEAIVKKAHQKMYFLYQQILTDHHCQPYPPSSYLNICRVRTPERKFSTDRSHPGRSPFDLHWHALYHKAGTHKKIQNVSLERRCVNFIHNAGGVCTCWHVIIWFVGLLWISTVIYQCSLHYYALLQTLRRPITLASRLRMCPVCNHWKDILFFIAWFS